MRRADRVPLGVVPGLLALLLERPEEAVRPLELRRPQPQAEQHRRDGQRAGQHGEREAAQDADQAEQEDADPPGVPECRACCGSGRGTSRARPGARRRARRPARRGRCGGCSTCGLLAPDVHAPTPRRSGDALSARFRILGRCTPPPPPIRCATCPRSAGRCSRPGWPGGCPTCEAALRPAVRRPRRRSWTGWSSWPPGRYAARDDDLHRLDLRRSLEPDWFQRPGMVGYAAYADRFAGTLAGVAERAPYLTGPGGGLPAPDAAADPAAGAERRRLRGRRTTAACGPTSAPSTTCGR